ncbi:uncharacterized protein At2g39795, mitochondrial-like [Quercus robur]|uniref:uncharacterized protein At2g39795, mitochondrial-like n=1 Tax=Quercus robur TaxID=38942 RepID=UPI002162F4D8|nr:uncharacterized protein At2g39795, mitochondrial-like [Quercus robur]
MAFTSILRKSASSLTTLASQLARGHGNYHCALFTAITHSSLSPLVPNLHYSSVSNKHSSDETLLPVIQSKIQCLRETDGHGRVEQIPSDFPFEIVDKPGLQTLTLKRKYQGEDIEVEVHMPDIFTGENNDHHDGNDNSEKPRLSILPLVVSVSKQMKPSRKERLGFYPYRLEYGDRCLEFSCISYPDEIEIDSLVFKLPEISDDENTYEGPSFIDMDKDLQKAFKRYLRIRGIKPSTFNFLHKYMINKHSKEDLIWMKKLKKFLEA